MAAPVDGFLSLRDLALPFGVSFQRMGLPEPNPLSDLDKGELFLPVDECIARALIFEDCAKKLLTSAIPTANF